MAEYLFNHICPASLGIKAESGGLSPKEAINPHAKAVLEELGLDLSGAHCKGLPPRADLNRYYIFVMCGCGTTCPNLGGLTYYDAYVDDPSGSDDLDLYRKALKIIRQMVSQILTGLQSPTVETTLKATFPHRIE